MALLIKLLHIITLTIWVAGLLYMPRLFALRVRSSGEQALRHIGDLEHRLYFEITTPAAVLSVVFGSLLILFGFEGAWLPVKLSFVVMLVMFHVYCGRLVLKHSKKTATHGTVYFLLLNLIPIPLAMVIIGLAVAKPI